MAKQQVWRSAKDSDNYRNGEFKNLSVTPMIAPGASYPRILKDYFRKPKNVTPAGPLPSVQTDLKRLYSEKPVIIWFGHSSYLIHCRGINILIDPVFSTHASPVPAMVKAYPGTNVYKAEDMPPVDILILTHNHYDHLDKRTIARLRSTTKSFYVPLGVGKDIACGGKNVPITEMDWWETERISPDIQLTATPARHFSGRGLKRGGSLWSSFVLCLYGYTIFIGGDSGYDDHFKVIGNTFGPFDLTILECGQYNAYWPHIHMMPEETVQASIDLKSKLLLPVHWAKFTLALHPWNEPIKRVVLEARRCSMPVATPLIGEPIVLNEAYPSNVWWNI